MTSSAMSNSAENLDPLLDALSANITVGGNALKESLTRLNQEMRNRFPKDALLQLVARIGSVAASRENAFSLFIRALQQLPATVTPETAIRGLLFRKIPLGGDDLLYDLIVWCLVPDAGKKGSSPEVIVLSSAVLRDLERSLGGQFPLLGVHLWDRARDHRASPCWCEAWAETSKDVLQHAAAREDLRPDVVEQYVERFCQAESRAARRILGLLLFVQEEMGPLDENAISRIRQAPVGAELARQVSDLLPKLSISNDLTKATPSLSTLSPDSITAGTPSKNEAAADAGGEIRFEDLPEQAMVGLKSLIAYIRDLLQAEKTSVAELATLRQERQQHQEEVNRLRTAARRLEEHQRELQSELTRAREDRESEQRCRQELEKTVATLQIAVGGLEKELQRGKEDYERLAHRSEHELGQIRQHVLDGLHGDLRETWELMARMLEKVQRGERESRHLASVWNQLDEILWSKLGTSGFPVDEPST